MQKCLIYSRVSTDVQDFQSQIDELKKYAKYKEYEVVQIFSEKITGFSKANERIEFQKLVEFVEGNKVNHILVWEISRLGRSMVDCLNTIKYFTDKKINIYAIKEGINTLNEHGEKEHLADLMISIFSSIAEMEASTTKARSIRGLRASAAKGKAAGSKLQPYGFKKDAFGMLVIDDEEADVIREIFDLYMDGLGTMAIASYLNKNNVPTKYQKAYGNQIIKFKKGFEKEGNQFKWRDAVVYGILKNPIYYGKRKYKDEFFEVPAIVLESTFKAVAQRLEEKYNKKGINTKYENLVKDKIKCGNCGKSYFMHKRSSGKDQAYKCLSGRYQETCGNPSIGINKLNDSLFIFLNIYFKGSFNNQEKAAEIEKELSVAQIELDNALIDLKDVGKQKEKLLNLHLTGLMDLELYTKKFHEYDAKLKGSEVRINNLDKKVSSLIKLKDKAENGVNNITEESFRLIIKDQIDYLKVYELKDKGGLTELFTNKIDKVVIIELKMFLESSLYFIVSQRTNNVLILNHIDEKPHQILAIIRDNFIDYTLLPISPYPTLESLYEHMANN